MVQMQHIWAHENKRKTYIHGHLSPSLGGILALYPPRKFKMKKKSGKQSQKQYASTIQSHIVPSRCTFSSIFFKYVWETFPWNHFTGFFWLGTLTTKVQFYRLTDVTCMCRLNSSMVVLEMVISRNIPSSFEVNWQPHSVCKEPRRWAQRPDKWRSYNRPCLTLSLEIMLFSKSSEALLLLSSLRPRCCL